MVHFCYYSHGYINTFLSLPHPHDTSQDPSGSIHQVTGRDMVLMLSPLDQLSCNVIVLAWFLHSGNMESGRCGTWDKAMRVKRLFLMECRHSPEACWAVLTTQTCQSDRKRRRRCHLFVFNRPPHYYSAETVPHQGDSKCWWSNVQMWRGHQQPPHFLNLWYLKHLFQV